MFSRVSRRFLFQVHLWTGVSSGLFFAVLGVTGALLGFQEPIDRALHLQLHAVAPSGQRLPLSQIVSSVQKTFPSDGVVAVIMPQSPRDAWQVALPSGIAALDPYTGRVLGLRQRGTAFTGVVRQIHVSLACGRIGRTAVRWIDFAALVLLLSGIRLWWPVRRIGIRRRSASAAKRTSARRFWFDVHNSAGALSFVMLIILVATGAVLSCEGSLTPVLNRISRHHPRSAAVLVPPPEKTAYLSADEALAIAKSALPGAVPTRIQMPDYGGTYKIEMADVGSAQARVTDTLTVEPYSGRILADDSARNASLAERVLTTTAALHTGTILGGPGQVVMALASLLVALQMASGAMMLWKTKFAPEGNSR